MKVAVIQMVSSDLDVLKNLSSAKMLIAEAASAGAELVVLPENFALFSQRDLPQKAEASYGEFGTLPEYLAQCAKTYGVTIIGGTIPLCENTAGERVSQEKVFAASCIFNPEGQCVGRYDKIHLFDAGVEDGVGQYRESERFLPGADVGFFQLPEFALGLGVCYDLRFPEYFRDLSSLGAKVLAIPSAFTYVTGAAHWLTLLRARAIENQCYVLASNQGGWHSQTTRTWGESCIISPWGDILARIKEGEGYAIAELDFAGIDKLRQQMPVLNHRRLR